MNFKTILTSFLILLSFSRAWAQLYHFDVSVSTYDSNNAGIKVTLAPSLGGDTLTQFTNTTSNILSFSTLTDEPVNIIISKEGYKDYTLLDQKLSCFSFPGGSSCDFSEQLASHITLYPDTFMLLIDSVPNNRLLSNKTYAVLNKIDIQNELIIEPGATIFFDEYGTFNIPSDTRITAIGTPTDSIKIYGRKGYFTEESNDLKESEDFLIPSSNKDSDIDIHFSYASMTDVHIKCEDMHSYDISSNSNIVIEHSVLTRNYFELNEFDTKFSFNNINDVLQTSLLYTNNFLYERSIKKDIELTNNHFYNSGNVDIRNGYNQVNTSSFKMSNNRFDKTDALEINISDFKSILFTENVLKVKKALLDFSSRWLNVSCNDLETSFTININRRKNEQLESSDEGYTFSIQNNYFNFSEPSFIGYHSNYSYRQQLSVPEIKNNYFNQNEAYLELYSSLTQFNTVLLNQNTFRDGILLIDPTSMSIFGNIFDVTMAYSSDDVDFYSNSITTNTSCGECFLPTLNHTNYKEDDDKNRQVSEDFFLIDSLPFIKENSPLDFTFGDSGYHIGYDVTKSCNSFRFIRPIDIHSISGNITGIDSALVMAINTSDSTHYLTPVINERYEFDRLTSGSYILHAIPYPKHLKTNTPTLFANKLDIHLANEMLLKEAIINANFSMLSPAVTTGNNSISGTIRYRDILKTDTASIYNKTWFTNETWQKNEIDSPNNALHLPVLLLNKNREVVASSFTDEKGHYSFSSVEDGSYTLISQRYGYELSYDEEIVLDNEDLTLHAFLEEAIDNITANRQFDQESDILLFPNPITDYLTFDLGNELDKNITILDIYGKTIKTISSDNQHITINTSKWSKGIYLAKVGNKQFRLIK